MKNVIVGGDIGGTSSKIAVLSDSGQLLARATTPGGNIRSSGEEALDNIIDAVAVALGSHELQIAAAHLGVAGAGPARHQEIASGLRTRWEERGWNPDVLQVTSDLEIAFAGSSPSPNGLLLLCGTGAVAAAIKNYQIIGRCDGMGYLLGDEGSAVWIGTAALKAAASAMDFRGPETALSEQILQFLRSQAGTVAPGLDPRQELISYAYGLTPAQRGSLAPLVLGNPDPVAQDISRQAAAALARTAVGAWVDASCPDLLFESTVFAGSLLEENGPLRQPVTDALTKTLAELDKPSAQTLPGTLAVHAAASPLSGAVFLASEEAKCGLDLEQVRREICRP